jgi:methyl-accepting chemotaxis protein
MAASLSESSQQLGQISMAITAVKGLQDNFEDISQYYKTRFTVVTKHNENLAKDIADALGQIQYQDVVRQCVERIRFAIGQRNEYLKSTVDRVSAGDDDLTLLPALLEMIRVDYLTEEEKHKHSARHTVGDGSELKIELF